MLQSATQNANEIDTNQAGEAPFYSMSVAKLTVMLLCTSGAYQVYWFYKQWSRIKQRERTDVTPWLRAIFPVFFALGFGGKIDSKEKQLGMVQRVALQDLMGIWLMLTLVLNVVPDPYGLLVVLLSLAPLPFVQARINRLNAAVTGEPEPATSFSTWNWLVIVPGSGIMALALIGFLVSLK